MKKQSSIFNNPYFKITIVYLLAHFFLLILSGCWWDDWTFMSHDLSYINQVASSSGRPEWNILIPLCWSLTNNGRILIFFLYYLISIFLYLALRNSKLLNDNESLMIAILFTIIPVNDARLLISNFPYTVGLFLFFLGLFLFVKWNNSSRKVALRIIVLIIFFFSFILNSLLAFYYLLFIYLFILEYKTLGEENIIQKTLLSIKNILLKYPDFFILPFLYFVSNKLLFPITDAEFTGRSSISIAGLLKCIKYIPLSMVSIIKNIFDVYFRCITNIFVFTICLIFAIFVILKNKENITIPKNKIILIFLFGIVAFILGIFAYVEVRGNVISSTGVKGRDAILVPLGVSLLISSILFILKSKIRKALYVVIVILGIFSCNLLYLEWQKDYYYQLSLESLMDNEIIKNNDTFYLANLNESEIEGERYYTLNINANHVFNDETRLFIPKTSNLYLLTSKEDMEIAKSVLNYSHMMKDYNPDDYYLDAVLIYDANLKTEQVINLKFSELFDNLKFNNEIDNIGTLKVVEVDDNFTIELIKGYQDGIVDGDEGVIEFLNAYGG